MQISFSFIFIFLTDIYKFFWEINAKNLDLRFAISFAGICGNTHSWKFWYTVVWTLPGSQTYIPNRLLFKSLVATFACASVK